jgi:AcrR family transcriptional regulator
MAQQDRAIRTRLVILNAAAQVFEQQGFQAATITEILKIAGVTRGALYFHFQSKEELALGILGEQDHSLAVPQQASKVQELVDTSLVHAYRLQTDPLVRAGVRLSLDQLAEGVDRKGPFQRWGEVALELLTTAREQGELLPHVVLSDAAELYVGAFAGVQAMSQALTNYEDLCRRVAVMQRYILPSITVPSVLASLELVPGRGARIAADLAAARVADGG